MSPLSIFIPATNLIWVGLFVVALYSGSNEMAKWFGLWTCGMLGFFFGCVYKDEQQTNDGSQQKLEKLAAQQIYQEERQRKNPGWCGRCGAPTKIANRE